MDQETLNQYFRDKWKSKFNHYNLTGIALVNSIKQGQRVLDVGCGNNNFKGHIDNLIGIDPVFNEADEITTIEDYNTKNKFDVAFCLDSLIFGNKQHILNQLDKVTSLMEKSSTIHFRSNSSEENKRYLKAGIEIFQWTQEDYFTLAVKFGFRPFGFYPDGKDGTIHAIWIRN